MIFLLTFVAILPQTTAIGRFFDSRALLSSRGYTEREPFPLNYGFNMESEAITLNNLYSAIHGYSTPGYAGIATGNISITFDKVDLSVYKLIDLRMDVRPPKEQNGSFELNAYFSHDFINETNRYIGSQFGVLLNCSITLLQQDCSVSFDLPFGSDSLSNLLYLCIFALISLIILLSCFAIFAKVQRSRHSRERKLLTLRQEIPRKLSRTNQNIKKLSREEILQRERFRSWC